MYLDLLEGQSAEQLVFCCDRPSGLRAVIAIHSTALGPGLGGCRFRPYESEADAVRDAICLAEGMTYKAALAGLDLGGGKAVIIGDPVIDPSEALWRAFGRYVDSLGGRYICAEDVGTTRADMDMIRRETRWVVGTSPALGGSDDPSPVTAMGVVSALRQAVAYRWPRRGLDGLHVAIQGVGKVGSVLCRLLAQEGCRLSIADVNMATAEGIASVLPCEVVDPGDLVRLDCDVLAPCALGGILTKEVATELRAAIVCGSANNQLQHEGVAELLTRRGILYCPDFVVNAGGLINVASELFGFDRAWAFEHVESIGDTTRQVLEIANEESLTTAVAARYLAQDRLEKISRLQLIRRPAQ